MIEGKDKGKQGKVVKVDRKLNRLLIEGINFVGSHLSIVSPIEKEIH